MAFTSWLKDEVRGNLFRVLLASGLATVTGGGLSIWAAVQGLGGPVIAATGLGAMAAVLSIIAALVFLDQRGWFSSKAAKSVGVILLLAGAFGAQQWFSDLLSEVQMLRQDSAKLKTIKPEDESHASLATDLASARGENAKLATALSEIKIEMAELKGQLSTATTALSNSQSQLSTSQSLVAAYQSQVADLQQQLARAKQPPAVVVGSGGGVPVNQAKMNLIAQRLAAGRQLQNSAPGRNAAEAALEPWVTRVDQWYGNLVAIIRKECTPQAVETVQNRAGMVGMTYGSVHQNQRVQNTFHNLDRIIANLNLLLQKPEMCP